MKTRLIAILGAATLLSGCTTLLSPTNCDRALTGLTAASDIAQVLIRYGYAPEAAAKAAQAIATLELARSVACAAANPPVAKVGQRGDAASPSLSSQGSPSSQPAGR